MPKYKVSGLKSFNIWVRNYLFLKNYITSEGAVSHNVLYHMYQQLSVVCYQISCYANYFELITKSVQCQNIWILAEV